MVQSVLTLISKEFKLELRRKSVLAGIGLYLVSLIFISYLTFSLSQSKISAAHWSALFWLTILFSVINSVAKSFIGEKRGLEIYYYMVASPQAIIISKIIYNTLLCLILSLAGFFAFQIFLPFEIESNLIFLATLGLTSIAFAASLSLISGISAKANNSNILMAVLSFPVMISVLLMAIRITKNVLDGLDPSVSYDELLNLLAIDAIVGGLAFMLFPYIWRS